MFTSYGGFDCTKTPIYADFDFDSGILEVASGQTIGYVKDAEGTSYPVVIATAVVEGNSVYMAIDTETPIVFEVPESNVIEGPGFFYGLYILDEEGEPINFYNKMFFAATLAELASEEEAAPTAVMSNKLPFNSFTVKR
jgi:hypothetical protein